MPVTVTVENVSPRILAAVRRHVKIADISTALKPALDEVWAFLGNHPGLRSDSHNIFLYDHTSGDPTNGMDIHFGVEVTRQFQSSSDVSCIETPPGRAVIMVHRRPYRELPAAHTALHQWIRDGGERMGAWSWEIYGDHDDDESKLEATIVYLLA